MIYFKAKELQNKPFIQWESVALSLKELQDLGLDDDPLIIAESDIPDFIFGVCPYKIVEGQLVERTTQEMDEFEIEYNTKTIDFIIKEIERNQNRIDSLKSIGEDYSLEENKLNELRIEYQFLKNKEQVNPLNF